MCVTNLNVANCEIFLWCSQRFEIFYVLDAILKKYYNFFRISIATTRRQVDVQDQPLMQGLQTPVKG